MNPSVLLNSAGNRCCLGFACQQMGVSDEVLKKRGAPASLFSAQEDDLKFRLPKDGEAKEVFDRFCEAIHGENFFTSNFTTGHLMQTNDNTTISNEFREAELNRIAQEIGIQFEFHGEYPRP
jgi:hypothetical protein